MRLGFLGLTGDGESEMEMMERGQCFFKRAKLGKIDWLEEEMAGGRGEMFWMREEPPSPRQGLTSAPPSPPQPSPANVPPAPSYPPAEPPVLELYLLPTDLLGCTQSGIPFLMLFL